MSCKGNSTANIWGDADRNGIHAAAKTKHLCGAKPQSMQKQDDIPCIFYFRIKQLDV